MLTLVFTLFGRSLHHWVAARMKTTKIFPTCTSVWCEKQVFAVWCHWDLGCICYYRISYLILNDIMSNKKFFPWEDLGFLLLYCKCCPTFREIEELWYNTNNFRGRRRQLTGCSGQNNVSPRMSWPNSWNLWICYFICKTTLRICLGYGLCDGEIILNNLSGFNLITWLSERE